MKYYREDMLKVCDNFSLDTIKYAIENNFNGVKVRTGYNYILSNGDISKTKKIGLYSELAWSALINLDDIHDGDLIRYNKPAAYVMFNKKRVVNDSNKLFHMIKNELSSDAKFNFVKQWELTSKSRILEKKKEFTFNNLLNILIYKTIDGVFSAYQTSKSLKGDFRVILEYAMLVGIAGQIKNDILDFGLKNYEEYAKFSDIKNGYVSYPLFLLSEIDKKSFIEIMKDKDINKCISLFEKYQILNKSLTDASAIASFAKQVVKLIPNKETRNILFKWADENSKFRRYNLHKEEPSALVNKIIEGIKNYKIFK